MKELKTRVFGLAAFAIGGAFGWFFYWQPLQKAQSGAVEISYHAKAVILVPVFLLLGVGLAAGGDRFAALLRAHPETRKLRPAAWLFVVVAFSSGIALFLWFQSQMEALGYS